MKVVVITGSAHKRGTSALLAEKFIEGAREAGHEVFRFDAAFKKVHPCIGCDVCNDKGGGCVHKDDMTELNPHIIGADAIAFVSPVYYYNINAQIKTVIDRFYANNAALQGRKKAVLMVSMADDTMESAEGPKAFFKNFCNYMEWEHAGFLAAASCWKREDIERTDYPQRARELGRSL